MKQVVTFCLLALICLPLAGQKKLTPATSSALAGIKLPAGTLQDQRILSTAAAAVLLEDETKKGGGTISGTEVYALPRQAAPQFNKDSLLNRLNAAGWKPIPLESTTEYWWLLKNEVCLALYFSAGTANYDFYLGKVQGTPKIPGAAPVVEKPVAVAPQVNQPSAGASNLAQDVPISGTWLRSVALNPSNGGGNSLTYGYSKKQYTFMDGGKYEFYAKTWDLSLKDIILRKESGTYQVSGNRLIVTPGMSEIETWSKKDGTDAWGQKLSSKPLPPENKTYLITKKDYGAGIGLNLILTPEDRKPTDRDGTFSSNSEFPNSYFYDVPRDASYLISLPEEQAGSAATSVNTSTQPGSGIRFTTTNFDDGWVATLQKDHVLVTKNDLKVYLHYPRDWNAPSSKKQNGNYTNEINQELWEIVVAPRYQLGAVKKYENSQYCYNCIYFFEADGVEKSTGKPCHVGLRIEGNYLIELVAPSEAAFKNEFSDQARVMNMWNYNKFAVTEADLKGGWTETSGAAANMYNVYTGAYAGMNAVSRANSFTFNGDGTYSSRHAGASGMVGSMSTYDQKYSGKATVSSWEITLTNRWEGKTEVYSAQFEAIMGGVILHLNEKGKAMSYHLAREVK